MNEVQRFLRYTIPGITTVFLFILASIISNDININEVIYSGQDNLKSIGAIIGSFLLTGGLGYITAQLYWGLYWFGPLKSIIAIEHRPMLKELTETYNGKFFIKDLNNTSLEIDKLSKRDAWNIVTYYFESKESDGKELLEKYSMNNRLVMVTHSLGATIVGAIIAFLAWLSFHIVSNWCIFFQLSFLTKVIIVSWITIILIMCNAYWSSLKAHENLSNTHFANAVIREVQKLKYTEEINIHYFK